MGNWVLATTLDQVQSRFNNNDFKRNLKPALNKPALSKAQSKQIQKICALAQNGKADQCIKQIQSCNGWLHDRPEILGYIVAQTFLAAANISINVANSKLPHWFLSYWQKDADPCCQQKEIIQSILDTYFSFRDQHQPEMDHNPPQIDRESHYTSLDNFKSYSQTTVRHNEVYNEIAHMNMCVCVVLGQLLIAAITVEEKFRAIHVNNDDLINCLKEHACFKQKGIINLGPCLYGISAKPPSARRLLFVDLFSLSACAAVAACFTVFKMAVMPLWAVVLLDAIMGILLVGHFPRLQQFFTNKQRSILSQYAISALLGVTVGIMMGYMLPINIPAWSLSLIMSVGLSAVFVLVNVLEYQFLSKRISALSCNENVRAESSVSVQSDRELELLLDHQPNGQSRFASASEEVGRCGGLFFGLLNAYANIISPDPRSTSILTPTAPPWFIITTASFDI